MQTLKLYWLGPARIELKGRTVKAETRKSTALLAYLSLLERPCSREFLAALFWPEANQHKALGNLRRTLFSLNSRLPGWVTADRQTVSLRKNDALFIDVEAFRGCLAAARQHPHPPDEPCDQCEAALKQALAYERGEFLEGLNLNDCPNFDEWQLYQRDCWRQELGQVLQRLTAMNAAQGQIDEAIPIARHWLALDRLHEPACRTLMELYVRAGQRTAAVRQYEELAQLLSGQEPELETRQLYHRIQSPVSTDVPAPHAAEQPSALPLLKTKLYIPTVPVPGVVRSALLDRLSEAEHHALTLLSAPAGFGKTTLLAQWIAQSALPIAWLSLDGGDNDPYRFLEYLVAALRSIDDSLGLEAQQVLRSNRLVPPHIILASLINDLSKMAEPCAIALDDCQFLVEHAVYEALAYLIDHLPGNVHLLIATRSDPPLALGRLRAHGQMLELRLQDFRFTSEEAAGFLNGIMQLGLSQPDIEALEARTEGWVAGLKMAALSLQGHENASEFVRAFSGSHRYVLDYLMEEVLRRQPPHVRTFLLETSCLEKLSGPLCDALMSAEWKADGHRAQDVLEYLEASNLFMVPLDDNKQWYRYHHLFAELLLSQQLKLSAERVNAMHLAACAWFEANGLVEEGVLHAIRGGDLPSAARLIEDHTPRFLSRNEFSLYLDRLQAIPREIWNARPWLIIGAAWARARLGKIEEVEPLLQQAEAANRRVPQGESADEMAGYVAIIRANVANLRGDAAMSIEQTSRARSLLPAKNPWLLDNLRFQRGFAHMVAGDFASAEQEWVEAIRCAMQMQDFDTCTNAAAELGSMRKIQGKLQQAYEAYQSNHRWLEQQGCSVYLSALEIGMADVLLEWNKLPEARQLLLTGLERARLGGRINTRSFGDHVAARLFLALGQPPEAAAALADAEQVLSAHMLYPRAVAEQEAATLALWSRQGKVNDVAAWLREHPPEFVGDFQHELGNIVRARALIRTGAFGEALGLLDRLAEAAENGGRTGRVIEALALRATALGGLGQQDASLASLARALKLAEPEGYVRLFLDEGTPMLSLLAALIQAAPYPEQARYAERLLAANSIQEENRA